VLFSAIALLAHCAPNGPDVAASDESAADGSGRAWSTSPAIVQIDSFTEVFAVSDAHGGYERFVNLLAAAKVVDAFDRLPAPGDVHWAAGTALLVVTGDMIDKGDTSIEVIDLMMSLQGQADAAGGRVVVTMGNHEAEFLADPKNSKAAGDDGIDTELHARGIKPKDFASWSDPHGRWLRNLPFGVIAGDWYFSHCGNTREDTRAELEAEIRDAVDSDDSYGHKRIIGDKSVLAAEDWYDDHDSTASKNADALGVSHFVFGHNPHAFDARGKVKAKKHGLLVKIDTGMTPLVSDSHGALLHIARRNGALVADSIDHHGDAEQIWPNDE
jgi:hypothetical protein